ncbi:hypothetical protein BK666_03910 [Pseudomonas frederiksbergensis]|uniref:YncE family protein n=1 Tax=Pseudomonas frederiksbergensis TaxID=104087 RepID=A0A423KF20_9PSED|nr:hypothetical protein [Pseudomonas frederiksbergensis]RON51397.1 hypothetical protein BK666_03910 [Pseudomonas frederiksbergensis]
MTRLPALESDSTLALRPPYFPSGTDLIDPRHYAGGIPIRALEGNLQCIISPWGVMGIGDEVELFWHSLTSPAVSKTIQFDHEVNQQVVLWVPRSQVLKGDAMPVFYRVRRRSQGPEDSEPKETYLVKTTRPGGYDDSPEPGHSGFRYTFLTDISGGVDADMADRGVQLRIEPYENMTAFDRIVCRWGSQEVMHYPVTQEQVDDPVNNPIVITFTREVIEKAGDGSRVVVTYQVIDCVGNYPDERDPWAPFRYVLVDLGGNRLDAPLVLINNRPTNSIDLDQLGDDDVEVRVYTTTADFAVGDSVRLTWTGTPAQGSPIIVGPLQELVDFVPFQLDFTIPNAAVRAIAQGFATVSYVRVRSGEADRPSKTASVNVQGDISRLPAPSVAQAPGGTLPPDSPYATISVPYFEGRKTGDLITVHCQGRRPGGGETYYPITIIVADSDGKAAITRDLPGSQIAPLQGGTLKIYYVVANDDLAVRSERDSLPLELNVGVALPDFKQPEITEADGDVLLPENTPNGANVIAPFNVPDDTRAGDTVGLRWTGSVTGAHPLYEIPLTNQTAGKPVPFFIRPEHIHPNLNGTVTVDYYRKRTGEVTRFSMARVWSVGGVQLELKAPGIKEAPGTTLNPVAAKDVLTAVVDYDDMQVGDKITVTWAAAAGRPAEGSHTTTSIDIVTVSPKDVPLPNSLVAFCLGTTVTVTYSVTRGSDPAQPSLPLLLNVLNIPSGDLPTPTIAGVTARDLNVAGLKDDDKLAVNKWLLQLSGQRVWLSFKGIKENGAEDELIIWEGPPHNPSAGLETPAPIDWLRTLKDGSELTITFMVNFDKVANRASAVRFPVRIYTVKAVAAIKLEFINGPYVVAPMGRVNNIQLSLHDLNNTPVANGEVTLTLPAQFKYADGGNGARGFKTDSDGTVVISGVKANMDTGGYKLIASSSSVITESNLIITAQPPLGTIAVRAVDILISPDGTRLYCGVTSDGDVVVADTMTLLEVARFRMPIYANSRVLAISPDGERLYLTTTQGCPVVADTISNTVIGLLPAPYSAGIAISPDSRRIYVGCRPDLRDYQIAVIDAVTLQKLSFISVADFTTDIVISPDGNWLYAKFFDDYDIHVIDTRTNTVLKSIPTPGSISRLAMSPNGAFVYVCNPSANLVTVISTASNQAVKNIPVSYRPSYIAFGPDGACVYISHQSYSLITVIDVMTQRVIHQIDGSSAAYGIAVSADSSRVYIARPLIDTIEVIQGF